MAIGFADACHLDYRARHDFPFRKYRLLKCHLDAGLYTQVKDCETVPKVFVAKGRAY
jgi:hypothetical protein